MLKFGKHCLGNKKKRCFSPWAVSIFRHPANVGDPEESPVSRYPVFKEPPSCKSFLSPVKILRCSDGVQQSPNRVTGDSAGATEEGRIRGLKVGDSLWVARLGARNKLAMFWG